MACPAPPLFLLERDSRGIYIPHLCVNQLPPSTGRRSTNGPLLLARRLDTARAAFRSSSRTPWVVLRESYLDV